MPMGTHEDPTTNNVQMAPAPTARPVMQMQTPRFPGSDEHGRDPTRDKEYPAHYQQGEMIPPPGWAGTVNVDEPYLPEDFDKALVARCYPKADSHASLREIAYAAGRESLRLAREITRLQAEHEGQPDPHDLSNQEPPPHMRPGQPNPGQPFLANPPPQPPPGQQPGQPQPGQPPHQPNQPGPQREAEARQAQEQRDHDKREHDKEHDKAKDHDKNDKHDKK